MEMMRYECVAEAVTTADGYRLTAGCICRKEAAEEIRQKLKGLSDKDNPLNRVNHAHMLLKVFLYAHTSFLREKTQGYLNLFAFVMNPPLEPLEKVDLLMNLAFKSSKKLRYRDFYGKT